MAVSSEIQGVKRTHCNRYDYVTVHVGYGAQTVVVYAREGGDSGGVAELPIGAAKKLVARLQAAIAEVEARK